MLAEKTVLLPVSTDEASALITEPDRLRRWQTVSARVDLRAGGQYRWTVIVGHVAAGTFVEVEPGRRIVFGWGWEGSPDLGPDVSTVTINLEPVEGGALVSLVVQRVHDRPARRPPDRLDGQPWPHGGGGCFPSRLRDRGVAVAFADQQTLESWDRRGL
jgi:uncharacterized protein YndB with AHSA1/START domain